MEHSPTTLEEGGVRSYERWRNRYAEEEARCTGYDRHHASWAGRRYLSWLDARMVRRALAGSAREALVLDMPCGGGRIARALRSYGFRPVVADYSQWMVKESRPAAEGGVRLDAMRLPFRDKAFPASVCFRFLHSVPPVMRLAAIRELGRVSEVVVLNYLNALSVRNLRLFLMGAKQKRGRVTEPQAIAEVESAGLKVLRCVYKARFCFEDFVVVAQSCEEASSS
ncbi:MAG: class I SAM-dependent methyltransferase [Planctomycetota bacterium]